MRSRAPLLLFLACLLPAFAAADVPRPSRLLLGPNQPVPPGYVLAATTLPGRWAVRADAPPPPPPRPTPPPSPPPAIRLDPDAFRGEAPLRLRASPSP